MKTIFSTFAFILILSSSISAAEEGDSDAINGANTSASGAQPSVPTIPRTEPNVDKNRISELLKHQSPETNTLQLDTGKENEKLIAFYLTEGSGIKQGGIIMFPDQNTHMGWPDNLNLLREGLSNFGWYTLSIYLPQPKKDKIPKRTLPVLSVIKPGEANESASEENKSEETEANTPAIAELKQADSSDADTQKDVKEEPAELYQEKTNRLGNTALTHMKATDDISRFIVMGIGTGATWAAQYVRKNEQEEDLRLVMIDARNPQETDAPDLLEILPEIKSTIIDLHHSSRFINKNTLAPESPARRLRLARQKRMNNFHQSRMPAMADNWKRDNSWLVKHVRGMINTYIIKAEQENRSIQLDSKEPKSKESAPG